MPGRRSPGRAGARQLAPRRTLRRSRPQPHGSELSDLVGELATRSPEFSTLWAAHNVRLHTHGVKQLNHPVFGELELSFNRLEVLADGLTIVAYTAEPGSRSAEALALLASWTATSGGIDGKRLAAGDGVTR